MAVETASFISDLNPSWPDGSETFTQGDDHLRLIKNVLRNTFPNVNGAVIATATELNTLAGMTGSVKDLITSASFPAGTVLVFAQASPPIGWTLVSVAASYMLTVGVVAGGNVGGAHDPVLMNVVPAHSHDVSGLTIGMSGEHQHTYSKAIATYRPMDPYVHAGSDEGLGYITDVVSGGAHTHSVSGGTISDNIGTNWQPRYLGTILCRKS